MDKEQLYLTEDNLSIIKEKIQTELLKRGINTPIIKLEEYVRNGSHYIQLQTESFQTFPVLFKKLWIESFGTSIMIDTYEEEKIKYYRVWIRIYYSYEHFEGGSNGCKLFNFNCNVSLDNKLVNYFEIN